MKQITLYIHHLIKQWKQKGFTPLQINQGNCDSFADELAQQFPQGHAIWGDTLGDIDKDYIDAHCFFLYKKMFYDAECPQGVTQANQLPFYQRISK